MNLNEALAKKKNNIRKNRFKNSYGINKIREQNPEKIVNINTSTTSSEVNWGTKHIRIPNTPQTARKSGTSSKTSTEDASKIIVALTEGRGEARHEVGLAAICVSKPHLVLCQISDNQSYVNTLTKINLFDPNEIIVPHTFLNQENRLIKKIEEKFPNRKLTGAPRSTFNKINGKDILSDLCIPSLNGILLILQHRYYAVAAASALITYIQDGLYVYYGAGTIKIEYQESEGHAIIDISTADNLELVRSVRPAHGNKYSSLLGVMNHCKTKIGTRTLRSSILQPLFDKEALEERISCVTALMNQPETLISIQTLLEKVSNIDHILTIGTIVLTDPQKCSNRQLNYLLTMNSLLDLLEPLNDVLSNLENSFFIQLRKNLENTAFSFIKKTVRETIQEYAHPATGQAGVFQRCYAIKPGINGLLDLVRRTFSERLKDMQEYVQLLADKYGFALALSNDQTKGYHIIISLSKNQRSLKKSDLPAEFIQVQRLVDKFTAKTPELMNLSTRIDDIMSDILKISNTMVHTLLIELKQYIPLFHELCEQMAYLDLLQSLAETSLTRNYVKPEFGEFTELINARHPLLDFLLPTVPVPNSMTCSTDFNIHIITGPNGSGKSILIRQLVLLQVMAQVGCYVPAESAYFRPANQIFARIYLEDNMEYGASAFVLEIKEMQYIMNAVTPNSLVIIDELGRSTSFEDGTALAMAIIEQFAQMSTFVYVTTHYTLLTKLYDMYPNVKLWQLETIPDTTDPDTYELDYKYNVIPGVTTLRRYGVYIVRGIWPDTIMQYVNLCLAKLSGHVRVMCPLHTKQEHPKKQNLSSYKLDEECRLKYQIEADFRKLKCLHKLTIEAINQRLKQYQNDLAKLGHFINVHPLRKENVSSITEEGMLQIYEVPVVEEANSFINTSLEFQRAIDALSPEPRGFEQNRPREPEFNNFGHFLTSDLMNLSQRNAIITPELPNSFHGVQNSCSIQDNLSNVSNYTNISNFLAETPENIYKLVPEVQIHQNFSSTPSDSFRVMDHQHPKQTQETLPSQNEFNTPHNISRTSNQVFANHTIKIGGQNINDDIDLESIQTDLDIFSQAVSESDVFEGETVKFSNDESDVMRYISPKVIIHEGPDDESVSFGETDQRLEDFQENVQLPLCNPRNVFSQNDVSSDKGAYRSFTKSPGAGVFGGNVININHHDDSGANFDPEQNSLFSRTDQVAFITASKGVSKSRNLDSSPPFRSSDNKTHTEHENESTSSKSGSSSKTIDTLTYASKVRNLERNSSSTSVQNMNEVTDISTSACQDLDCTKADQDQFQDLDGLTVNKSENEEGRRTIGTNYEEQTETKARRKSLLNHSESERSFSSSRNLNLCSPQASSFLMYDNKVEERTGAQITDRNESSINLAKPEDDTSLVETLHFEDLHITSQLANSDITNSAEIEQPVQIKSQEKNQCFMFSTPKKDRGLMDARRQKKKRLGTLFRERSNSSINHLKPKKNQSLLKPITPKRSDTTNDNQPEEMIAAKTIENNLSKKGDPSNPINDKNLNSSAPYTTSDVTNKAEIEKPTQIKPKEECQIPKMFSRPIKSRSLMDAGRPKKKRLGNAFREISKRSSNPPKTEENQSPVSMQRDLDNSDKTTNNKNKEEIAATTTETSQGSLIYSKHEGHSSLTYNLDYGNLDSNSMQTNSNIHDNTDMEQPTKIDSNKKSHNSIMFSSTKKKPLLMKVKKKKNRSEIKIMEKTHSSPKNAVLEEDQSLIDASRLRNLDRSGPELDENIVEQKESTEKKAEENKTTSINSSMSNKIDSLADASKFRNLDGSSRTSSSKNISAEHEDEMQVKTSSSNEQQSSLPPENQDQKNYASLSDASKMRNLDNTASTSSTTGTNSKKLSTTTTSLSSVSQKRNLDGPEQNTNGEETNGKRDQSSAADVDECKIEKTPPSHNFPKKRKFNCVVSSNPDTSTTSEIRNSTTTSKEGVPEKATKEQNDTSMSKKKDNRTLHQQTLSKRFKPPKKLRPKEIREEYAKQDNLMLQKAAETSDLNKYYKQLINRPSVKQYKNLKHLAYAVRTDDGVAVIPTVDTEIKKVKTNGDYSLFKRHYSNENVDVSIFSDKNAQPFEQYLNSTEKKYKNFSFSFQKHIEAQVQGSVGCSTYGASTSAETVFQFGIQNTFASTFVKKQEVKVFEEENSFTAKNVYDETLTPDGFYKRNKEDITKIVKKYLPSTQSTGTNNIFEDDNISTEDLIL